MTTPDPAELPGEQQLAGPELGSPRQATADSVLVPGLEAWVAEAQVSAGLLGTRAPLQVVAFFDLSESSRAKLELGDLQASRRSVTFCALVAHVTRAFGGRVIKLMGDGVLCSFPELSDACQAAINIRHATHELLGYEMTAGLTSGSAYTTQVDSSATDLLGHTVDRAARIQSLAQPGQVLIDSTFQLQVRSELAERRDILITGPRYAEAKGIGRLELFEISLQSSWDPLGPLALPFRVSVGRPTDDEKLGLIEGAAQEIIEIGIGLRSFANYFVGERPSAFRDPIRQLVRAGVNLTCYGLDVTYLRGWEWLAEQEDATAYRSEARKAKATIEAESEHARRNRYRGKISFRTYQRVPEFWCLGVDIDDAVYGRMFFSSYLMDVGRPEMAVMQVSRESNEELFDVLMRSVNAVRLSAGVRPPRR